MLENSQAAHHGYLFIYCRIKSTHTALSLSLRFFVCVCRCTCVNIHVYVLDNHGEVLKRGQLMGNQRKQRPWHCGTRWRLTLLSNTLTHAHMNVVKLWHVISSPLVTRVCTIIVTHFGATGNRSG